MVEVKVPDDDSFDILDLVPRGSDCSRELVLFTIGGSRE
jgi:hypothetical protein